MRQIIIWCWMMIMSHTIFSQSKIKIDPVIGLNISGFPKISKGNTTRGDKFSEKIYPVISPIFGLCATLHYTSHSFMSIGIEFNQSGEKEISKREDYDRLNQRIYNFQEIEIKKLWKLSFPLIIGYQGNIKKLRVSGFVGYRRIYYSSGKHQLEVTTPDFRYEKSFNPFNNPDLQTKAKPNTGQLIIGGGTHVNERLQIAINFSAGGYIYYAEKPGTSASSNGYVNSYSRSDIALMLKYSLSKIKNLDKE